YAPSPRAKNRGVPPTDRNARTGELTPAGIVRCARAKSSSFRLIRAPPDARCARLPPRGGTRLGAALRRSLPHSARGGLACARNGGSARSCGGRRGGGKDR